MKSPKKTFRNNKKQENQERYGVVPPPISLEPSTWIKHDDDDHVMSFKLRSNPTDKNSPEYEVQAKSFATGTVEQYIWWKRDLHKIIVGQNITRAQDKFTMTKRLLHGSALAIFERSAASKDLSSNDAFEEALKDLAKFVFPKNALMNQKSWLRRSTNARKTSETPARNWVARLQEINMMLPDFPPDFNQSQMMRPEDVTEILEFGIPKSWKAKMVENGFVPADHHPTEFVEFCERLESAEQMLGLTINKTAKQRQEQKGSMPKGSLNGAETHSGSSMLNAKTPKVSTSTRSRCRSFSESKGADGCAYHINTRTHRSNECKVLMAQAANMRGQAAASSERYTKKNNGNQKKSGGDFHALITETVNKQITKALKQQASNSSKKRQRENADSEEEKEKNFDPHNFHLDLDQMSLTSEDSDTKMSDIDWGQDDEKEE